MQRLKAVRPTYLGNGLWVLAVRRPLLQCFLGALRVRLLWVLAVRRPLSGSFSQFSVKAAE